MPKDNSMMFLVISVVKLIFSSEILTSNSRFSITPMFVMDEDIMILSLLGTSFTMTSIVVLNPSIFDNLRIKWYKILDHLKLFYLLELETFLQDSNPFAEIAFMTCMANGGTQNYWSPQFCRKLFSGPS